MLLYVTFCIIFCLIILMLLPSLILGMDELAKQLDEFQSTQRRMERCLVSYQCFIRDEIQSIIHEGLKKELQTPQFKSYVLKRHSKSFPSNLGDHA